MGQSGRGLRASKNDDSGDDVKRQVDSDDNYELPIYQLVNVKNGGGKLIDIIKSSAKLSSSSFAFSKTSDDLTAVQREIECSVDKQIYELVKPLLYEEGRGKMVTLSRIWRSRLMSKSLSNKDELDESDCSLGNGDSSGYRWVCWKLEERGFVGETALHICFLLSTPSHMILAKKLLSIFPMLINDIYTCDQYFGESSLHMAIVNENVKIVKLLLDHGASVHERCLGRFFLPLDQQDNANESVRRALEKSTGSKNQEEHSNTKNTTDNSEIDQLDLHSNNFMKLDTNYDGYAYWGEYSLSFAACLGLSDCYKLLLAKGADPNKQDSNGNGTLHMTVIANRMDMFDLCYANGANLNLINKQNLSPLTLAAKMKRVDMFFHILRIQRQVDWIFCNVGFVEVPLSGLDSIDTSDGSCNDNSVLSIVSFGGSNEHLQMLDGLLSQLLKVKWDTAAKWKFYWWLGQFLLFMIVALIAYISRLGLLSEARGDALRVRRDLTGPLYSINYENINAYSEYILICYAIYYLWVTVRRIIPDLGFHASSIRSLAQAPEISMFAITCLLILGCIPLRLLRWQMAEDYLAALVMFTLPLKLLFFCRASKSVGSFVVMIYKIVVNDVLCFVVFLIIFVAGFSQSFLIMFKTHRPSLNGTDVNKNYFFNLFDGIISMHMMAYNEFGIVSDEFEATEYPTLAKVLFCIYMIIVSILLINMLIAMLGKTYQDIASQPNESLRQWARALLIVEKMWTNDERLQVLDRYSHVKYSSEERKGRYYGSTWALTQKDREDIAQLKSLNDENKINAGRLAKLEHHVPSHKMISISTRVTRLSDEADPAA